MCLEKHDAESISDFWVYYPFKRNATIDITMNKKSKHHQDSYYVNTWLLIKCKITEFKIKRLI